MTDELLVRVVFVDGADGVEFGRADVPARELPEDFTAGIALSLAGEQWSVESADPPDFRATGTLTLTLRRIDEADPKDVLFSLPTICETVPPSGQLGALNEDDWRQVEFVGTGLDDVVESEFGAIREIYEEAAEFDEDDALIGFRRLHVREHPAAPLPGPVSKARLLALLPAGEDADGDGDGSFFRTIGTAIVYGRSDGDAVTVLGVHLEEAPPAGFGPPLRDVMATFHLVLVDWCRCVVVGPDEVDDYLAEESDF